MLNLTSYYCFDIAVGLVWSNSSGSCGGCSVACSVVFNVRQVGGDDPDEMGYAGPRVRV
jgi:hypothetical protein